MKQLLAVLILLVSSSLIAQTTVKTDTHIYFVLSPKNAVLAVNRQTQENTLIKVGQRPVAMCVYKDFGYVLNRASKNISKINLKTMDECKMKEAQGPVLMSIYEGKLYILDQQGYMTIIDLDCSYAAVETSYVGGDDHRFMMIREGILYLQTASGMGFIDLKSWQSLGDIQGPEVRSCEPMVTHGQYAYLTNEFNQTVAVVDLKKRELQAVLNVGRNPRSMVFYGNKGFVLGYSTDEIHVFDLTTHKLITILSVDSPWSMHLYKSTGHIVSRYGNYIQKLDLETLVLGEQMFVPKTPQYMDIHEDTGYVVNWQSKNVLAIDLLTYSAITTPIRNDHNLELFFSDHDLYINGQSVFKLPAKRLVLDGVLLLDGYKGIKLDLYGDPDQAFKKMEGALISRDYVVAKGAFYDALAAACPKAYAIAAFAFLKGYWGAEKNQETHSEFFAGADTAYLLMLFHSYD